MTIYSLDYSFSYGLLKWGEVAQSCPTLCDSMDCSLQGFSVHGIFQARILEWVAISFPRGASRPRDRTRVSCIVGRCFTIWATREAPGKAHKGKMIAEPQVNIREGTQLHPSTENWIKDLLSGPLSQSLPSGSFHKPLILLHQRAHRLKTTITENWPIWSHGPQPCLTQWNYEPCHVGPPKMDRSQWRVLTKHVPQEKGMAKHFNILALRITWRVWKGKI